MVISEHFKDFNPPYVRPFDSAGQEVITFFSWAYLMLLFHNSDLLKRMDAALSPARLRVYAYSNVMTWLGIQPIANLKLSRSDPIHEKLGDTTFPFLKLIFMQHYFELLQYSVTMEYKNLSNRCVCECFNRFIASIDRSSRFYNNSTLSLLC
jgi:hypothetical protein